MTTPGFTAEASLEDVRQGALFLGRSDGHDGGVQAGTARPPVPPKADICVLLPYFPELESLCCAWIRDPGVSCMCQCKYSTGEFAPTDERLCRNPGSELPRQLPVSLFRATTRVHHAWHKVIEPVTVHYSGSYIAVDCSVSGTVPQWMFLQDFRPVTERKKKAR